MRISRNGNGRFLDNISVEQLWRSLKYASVYPHQGETGSEAKAGVGKWIQFYNRKRRHSALGRQPPAAVSWLRKDETQPDQQAQRVAWITRETVQRFGSSSILGRSNPQIRPMGAEVRHTQSRIPSKGSGYTLADCRGFRGHVTPLLTLPLDLHQEVLECRPSPAWRKVPIRLLRSSRGEMPNFRRNAVLKCAELLNP